MRDRRDKLNDDLQVTMNVDTAREIEARSILREMDRAERWRALDQAVQDGNAVMFAAFVNSPVPLVDDKAIAKAKQTWGEQRTLDVAKEYADLDQAIAFLGQDIRELIDGPNKIGRLSDDSMRAPLRSLAPDALAESEQLRNRSTADQLAGDTRQQERKHDLEV